MAQLTYMDVKTLAQEPSMEVRGMLASKIAAEYRYSRFTKSEEAVAVDIFRVLLKDATATIRASIAEQLAHCPDMPHDIIWSLANDATQVAAPVLEFSSVLTEDDLISIVRSTREVIKLCAVARRESISEALSGCLIEKANSMVLQNLFRNRGAYISADQLLEAWDVIAIDETLIETLVHRGGLPLSIAEKLYNVASDEVKFSLSKQYHLASPILDKAANDSREWTVLGLAPSVDSLNPRNDDQVEDLVDELYVNGRLTHSLLVRALCAGNMGIFECGMAKLADVPRINARILLTEASGLGIDAIYKAAAMPEGFFEAIKVLLRISLEETEFGRTQRADFRKRVIERIYVEKHNRTVENMEYLLSIIGGKITAPANVH